MLQKINDSFKLNYRYWVSAYPFHCRKDALFRWYSPPSLALNGRWSPGRPILSFAIYNLLIGYLLLHREEPGRLALMLFFIAMALHFLVNDFGLQEHHIHSKRMSISLLDWVNSTRSNYYKSYKKITLAASKNYPNEYRHGINKALLWSYVSPAEVDG